ncbi:MAG: hypothetical protein R2932_54070 [Caldilineaceae bacterium]
MPTRIPQRCPFALPILVTRGYIQILLPGSSSSLPRSTTDRLSWIVARHVAVVGVDERVVWGGVEGLEMGEGGALVDSIRLEIHTLVLI